MFVAGAHFDAEADAQVGDEITVIDVAGAARLLRVVADFGSLLVALERLDGDVDIKDPRQAECGGDAAENLVREPVETDGFIDAGHGQTHGVFTNSAAHTQQTRIDTIAAKGVDVGMVPVAGEHAE